jgi:hypothetical protein
VEGNLGYLPFDPCGFVPVALDRLGRDLDGFGDDLIRPVQDVLKTTTDERGRAL